MQQTKRRKVRRRRGRKRGKHLSTKMGVEMVYRSGWELAYFVYLDANPGVIRFYSEPFRIPYVSNKTTGRLRHYIPDLLIEYADKKLLVEIKPSKRVSKPVNVKKFTAARELCKINGWEFVVITERELKTLGLL